MRKFSSLILAIVMMLSLGLSAFSADKAVVAEPESAKESNFVREIDGKKFDIRRNIAPDNYIHSRSINSDKAVVEEPESAKDSNFIREIDGKKFDIRRSVAPDNYINPQLHNSTNSDQAAEATSKSTIQKQKGSIQPSASMPAGGGEYPYDPTGMIQPMSIEQTVMDIC